MRCLWCIDCPTEKYSSHIPLPNIRWKTYIHTQSLPVKCPWHWRSEPMRCFLAHSLHIHIYYNDMDEDDHSRKPTSIRTTIALARTHAMDGSHLLTDCGCYFKSHQLHHSTIISCKTHCVVSSWRFFIFVFRRCRWQHFSYKQRNEYTVAPQHALTIIITIIIII